MDINDAYLLAHKLIAKHLSDGKYRWKFEFNNAKKAFGSCQYGSNTHTIKLSRPLTRLNSVEQVTDTILHEIAHALDVEQRGFSNHDKNWVRIATSIGCNGQQYYYDKEVNTPLAKYTLKCNNCGHESDRHRKVKRTYACGSCCNKHNNGRYSDEYALELIQNY